MKVYTLTNVWEYLDTRAEGTCYGVYTTAEKAKKAMADAVEDAKEQWVECNRVEDVDLRERSLCYFRHLDENNRGFVKDLTKIWALPRFALTRG